MHLARYLLAGWPARGALAAPDRVLESADQGSFSSARGSRPQVPGQLDGAVSDPEQPAHVDADGIPEAAHLTVAALVQHHPESGMAGVPTPLLAALLAWLLDNLVETGGSVLQLHPAPQLPYHGRRGLAAHPDQIFALDLARSEEHTSELQSLV